MPTYTLCGCTIEVAKGGRSARATRHVDLEGKPLQPPEVREFAVIAEPDAPTPQVQAERWAKGIVTIAVEGERITADEPLEDVAMNEAGNFVPIAEAATEETTELDEADDGE